MNNTTLQGEGSLTVLITGANRGLGLEFAKKFLAGGYQVIGTARKPEEATDLKDSDSARIVNVSSKLGQLTEGDGSARGYGFSKTALNMVTRNLHASYSEDGVTVISLNPGHNRTDMGGDHAALDPKETAEQVFALVEGLTPEQSGKFWRYDGERMEW